MTPPSATQTGFAFLTRGPPAVLGGGDGQSYFIIHARQVTQSFEVLDLP